MNMNRLIKVIMISIVLYALYLLFGNFIISHLKNNLITFFFNNLF